MATIRIAINKKAMTISEYYLLPAEAKKAVQLSISIHSMNSVNDVKYILDNACNAIDLKLNWRYVIPTMVTAQMLLNYLED